MESIYRLFTDFVGVFTSRERLRQLWHISFYSNAFYIMLASALTSLLNFVFWIIVARFYSPADVGLASAVIAALALLASTAHLGLGLAIIRFLPQADEDANSLINMALTIGTLAAVLITGIFIIGLRFWSPALLFIQENPYYLAAFFVFTIASVAASLTGETFIAKRRSGFVVAQNLILTLCRLPLTIIMANFFHSFGIVSSWGISLVISLLVNFFIFLPRVQPGYRLFFSVYLKEFGNILRFSFANYLSNIFWGLPTTIIPLILLNMLGAELTAYFSIVWAIVNAFMIIHGAFALSLFVEGSFDEENLDITIRRSLKITFLVLVPVVILLSTIADKLLLLFGKAYYQNGAALLRILAPALLPSAITSIYLSIKRVEKKLKVIVSLTAFIALATLGLSYLLIPGMGVTGVGIAWLSVQGLVALLIIARWLRNGHLFARSQVGVLK
jgi:O-antigen/teichoic acid export membrane protein